MRNFLILITLLISFYASAQKITLVMIDKAKAKELSDVRVIINNDENKTYYTNENGRVIISNITIGTQFITITALGYGTKKHQIEVNKDDQTINIQCEAEAIQMDEIVVNANQWRKKEIISRLDIGLRPLQNAQEILRMVPGLFIGQHAGGGKAEQIFLRGFDIDHGTDIQLSVDGMPVNMVSHAHGQGYADLHFVIPEMIENVDFSKGPYLAEKGNFATAGWVDFKTKKYIDKNILKAEFGQFDTYRIFGAVNLLSPTKRDNGQSAYIATEYNFSNSFFDAPQNFNRFNVLAKANGKISNRTSYTLSASHFTSNWNHSGQIPIRAVEDGSIRFFGSIDPTEGGNTSRFNTNLQTISSLKNGGILKNQLYYSHYDFQLFSNFTFFLNDAENGDQIKQKENRHIIGYQSSYIKDHKLMGKNAEFTTGIQLRQDITNDTELSNTSNRKEVRSQVQLGDIKERNMSTYISENIQLNKIWSADLGLRFDHFYNNYFDKLANGESKSASASTLLPKASIYFNPTPMFQIYVKTGKGFHSNDTRVVVPQNGKEILPAAYGSDLGAVWKPSKNILIQPAIWYLWLDQEFVYVGDAGVVEPSGKTQRYGADLSIRYQLSKYLFADFDFNITTPRAVTEPKGEQYIPLAPIFTSVGGITYNNPRGFSANARYRYMGDRPAIEDNSIIAEGYMVTDVQASYKWNQWTLTAMVNNILDTRWKETQFNTKSRLKNEVNPIEEIHFTPGSPRFVRICLALEF